jgi:hypothetical protein
VLIHGRDEARGRQTIGALEAATGNGKLRWLRADFASRAPTSTDYSRPTLIRRLAIPPRAGNFES